MTQLPAALKSGHPARLFPDLAASNRENRMTSIFLALVPQIPELASVIFGSIGQRIGKRTTIQAWTEVVFRQGGSGGDQPDGYVEIASGSKIWTAIVEAKVGKNNLDESQVLRYVELARDNNVDAVITISNEFVTQANQSPVSIPGTKLRKTELFHWSWTWIATQCELLQAQMAVDDPEQAFLLSEFRLFLSSDGAGVERFTQMGPSWKQLVQAATHQTALLRSSPEVEEGVVSWFKEEKDLCLQISRLVGENVTIYVERKYKDDPKGRLRDEIAQLVSTQQLTTCYRIPNAAGDVDLVADLPRRTLSASITLKAPSDKVKTRSRVNWLLRMLKVDHENLYILAHWPGRT